MKIKEIIGYWKWVLRGLTIDNKWVSMKWPERMSDTPRMTKDITRTCDVRIDDWKWGYRWSTDWEYIGDVNTNVQ